jgi:hypothetical protein
MQVISDGVLFKKGAASQINQNAVHHKVYFGVDGSPQEKERHDTGQVSGYLLFCIILSISAHISRVSSVYSRVATR